VRSRLNRPPRRRLLGDQRIGGEAHSEALDEVGDTAGVHFECVTPAQLAEDLGRSTGYAAQTYQLGEESLEPGWGNDCFR
jgi:hypothetical protein